MVDLDDFKTVNDTLGHPVGDRLLAAVATRLSRVSRQGSVFRYGGEEFAVLLAGADLPRAVRAAERLRRVIGDTRIEVGDGETVPVTCSIGVASLSPGDTPDSLLRRADDALLEAKREGKNRVLAES
jgi:diguanylate cyclase (GGDEF)-like protein